MRYFALFLILACSFISGCGGGGGGGTGSASYTRSVPGNGSVLLVVEGERVEELADSLASYEAALLESNQSCRTMVWASGTAAQLRSAIAAAHADSPLTAALFIGNLPAAWFERTARFSDYDPFYEQFPCDLFFMDLDGAWHDTNNNGLYDSHGPLSLEIIVSRVTGSTEEINDYFARNVLYRQEGSLVNRGAFVFKDDDWQDYRPGIDWWLRELYHSLTLYESAANTTADSYLNFLSSTGAEFVYQWIHASPAQLYVAVDGSYEHLHVDTLRESNLRGSFWNLFDCSAARFTEENLATTYLTSDCGLAIVGSAKTGGMYDPYHFHNALAAGHSWGAAFAIWFERVGVNSDDWHLGMVLQGDPLLTIASETASALKAQLSPAPPSAEEMAQLEAQVTRDGLNAQVSSFEAYRNEHPSFF